MLLELGILYASKTLFTNVVQIDIAHNVYGIYKQCRAAASEVWRAGRFIVKGFGGEKTNCSQPYIRKEYAMSGSMMMRRGNGGLGRNDKEAVVHIKAITDGRKKLESINKSLTDGVLVREHKGAKAMLARFLDTVVPERMRDSIPAIKSLVTGEIDVLARVEGDWRESIDSVQGGLRDLAAMAIERREAWEQLAEDVKAARSEDWDAQTLQNYIMDRAGISIHDEVVQLLDEYNAVLTKEDKEMRKEDLLAKLDSVVVVGAEAMTMMGKVCGAGLQVLQETVTEFWAFSEFVKPVSVIRDAAKDLIGASANAFAGQKVLIATLATSLEAINVAVEGAKLMQARSIASDAMGKFLQEGAKSIDVKLAELEKAKQNRLAPSGQARRKAIRGGVSAASGKNGEPAATTAETGEIIDVNPE